MKTIKRVILGAAALVLAACAAASIYNVDNAAVTPNSGKPLRAAQVRSAIITAGTSLGWTVKDVDSSHLEGTLRLRDHTAIVDIPYSASKYSIVFKSAENLGAADGKIHKNYNSWVQNLDRRIRTEISRM